MWNSHQNHSVKDSTQMITSLPRKHFFCVMPMQWMGRHIYVCTKEYLQLYSGDYVLVWGEPDEDGSVKNTKKKRETSNNFIFLSQVCMLI